MKEKVQDTRYKLLVFFIVFFLSTHPLSVKAQEDTTVIEETPPEEETTTAADEEKQKEFLEIWRYADTQKVNPVRRVPANAVKKMQDDDDFWYANAEIKKKEDKTSKEKSYTRLWERKWFRTLILVIIIAGFAGFLLWYLAGEKVGLFRRRRMITEKAAAEDESIPEDIFAINYQKEIDKAVSQGNYRLAVRLHFLRLLKEMSERNIISYKQDRTNFDYLLQLHNTSYYNIFFRLTRNYEYSWYGQFDVSSEAYAIMLKDYDQFTNQMG